MTMFEYFEECKKGLPIPSNWVDISYLNDASPSFKVSIGRQIYRIMIDHENPNYRDCPMSPRFGICRYEDFDEDILNYDSLIETECFDALLNYINVLENL